jgi:two-component system nitrogen regulation response regulator GlnG
VFRAIGRLSQSHVTVLITGESGSGKELVARALHRHSPRADKPFVALNTAAIPKDLLESELFGHERGAFTGAQQMRRGRFEQAEGGTLFLDEIGDMPSELQTRLLRVLSDGHFYRVGGHSPQKANVRVIAATHQNLEERVRQGLFREDLFHRLNVIRLRLPSLRERTEDIPLLARHFLSRSARELGVEAKRLTDGALAALMRFAWPGNVRQLENVCHWLTVMAPAQVIESKDLPPEVRDATASHAALAARGDDIRTPGSEAPSAFAGHADGAARHLEGASPGEATIASAVGLRTGGAPLAGFPSGVVNGTDPSGAAAATGGAFGLGAGMGATAAGGRGAVSASAWANLLERDVAALLAQQPYEIDAHSELMDRLSREFESAVIRTALRHTRGRRIEAAQRLGIGRNTITRKIAELKLED